ncbi:hypothetical protein SADUNF_Sadunf05G0133700 [Salix dunnii]|uniref:Uncharacterized protein n=1 Tax=Salix dunnii TaxID=1413687 RepID=A0A835K8F2_9ROSI|nr:hypothetical protein SADUNF_Sadunf05G0133700 [Salix dunnii]
MKMDLSSGEIGTKTEAWFKPKEGSVFPKKKRTEKPSVKFHSSKNTSHFRYRVRKDYTQGGYKDEDGSEFRRDRDQDRSMVQTQGRQCFSEEEEVSKEK